MVEAAWGWFGASPIRYWLVATPFGVALLLAALFPARVPRWGFVALLGAAFLAFRWPMALYGYELNADESQFLAGARTFMSTPGLWGTVDAHAAGPLDLYPLTVLGWLGFPLNYATARFFGYFCDWASVVGLYFLLRELYSDRLARVAAIAPAAYFCLVRFWAVAHFSSEAVPAALFSVGIAALWIGAHRGRIPAVFLGALALGAVPWAKIQGLPVAAVGLAGAGVFIWWNGKSDLTVRRRIAIAAVSGAVAPSVLFGCILTVAGLWGEWLNAYIRAGESYLDAAAVPRARVLAYFLTYDALGYWALAVPLFALIALMLGACLFHARQNRILLGTLGICTVAGFCAAVAPARTFPHYLLLTVIPLSGFAGAVLGSFLEAGVAGPLLASRPRLPQFAITLYLAAVLVTLVGFTASSSISPQYTFPAGTQRLVIDPVAAAIRGIAGPSDTMAVWGWEPRLYVQTGLRQGTREAHTERQINPGPMQEFYRNRYLADFESKPPKIFVDAVGPGRFAYQDRRKQAHESWAELSMFISARYRLVTEIDGYRVYALSP